MSRSDEEAYRSLGEAIVAVLTAGLAFCLWLLAECSRVVIRAYTRWGHTRLLRLAAVLYVGVLLLAGSLLLLGANVVGAYLGGAATLGFVGAAWVIDAIYDERARQVGQDQDLGDLLDGSWWR